MLYSLSYINRGSNPNIKLQRRKTAIDIDWVIRLAVWSLSTDPPPPCNILCLFKCI